MSKVSVFNQGWIDLVFEGRNKNYGAYKLRQEDSKTTLTALFSGIALMGILVGIPVIANSFNKKEVVIEKPDALPPIAEDPIVKPVELPKKVTETKAAAPAPKPKQPETELTTFVATSEPVQKDPPTQDDLKNTNPGDETTRGTGEGVDTNTTSSKGPEDGTGTGKAPDKGTGNEPMLVGLLDKAPEYPGGINKFLSDVTERFDASGVEKISTVRVIVAFVVEKDGTLSNIRVLQNPGYALDKEAIRVLKSLKKKWKPGIKKGETVRTAYTLPIVINVKN